MIDLSPSLKNKLAKPFNIDSLTLESRVFQSPLSGVTDLVFRRLVRRYAPQSMMYTEMVSAREIHQLQELPKIMEIAPNEQPIGIQLFDCRPDFMAQAAQKAVAQGAQIIDINMGFPVNKITKKEHLEGLWKYKGERGIRQSRKHMAWYCKGFPGAAELRDRLSRLNSVTEGVQ
jgi:tRNA-dihydrouridine synthase